MVAHNCNSTENIGMIMQSLYKVCSDEMWVLNRIDVIGKKSVAKVDGQQLLQLAQNLSSLKCEYVNKHLDELKGLDVAVELTKEMIR